MIPLTQADRDAAWLAATQPRHGAADPAGIAADPATDGWHRPLLIAALTYQLGLLPVLWNEGTFAPSIVWTSIGLALMLAAIFSDPRRRDHDFTLTSATMAFIIVYPLMCGLSYLVSDNSDPERSGLLFTNAVVMGLGAVYFFLGAALGRDARSPGVIAALLVTGFYGFLERDSFSTAEIFDRFQLDGVRVDYQYLGDAFVFCALLVMPRMRSALARYAFLAAAITVMFMIPSRSAAFFGAAALVTATLLWSEGWSRSALIGALVIAFLGYHALPLEQIFAGTRFESIFAGTTDTSIDLRNEIFSQGKRIIAEHPLTGYWGWQVDVFNNPGLYVHNALDAWAQGGALPFALFVTAWLVAVYRCWQLWIDDRQAAYWCIPMLMFAGASWAFSRQTAYTLPMLALGQLAGQLGMFQRADDSADQIDRSDD